MVPFSLTAGVMIVVGPALTPAAIQLLAGVRRTGIHLHHARVVFDHARIVHAAVGNFGWFSNQARIRAIRLFRCVAETTVSNGNARYTLLFVPLVNATAAVAVPVP